jgi:hypothetical protein
MKRKDNGTAVIHLIDNNMKNACCPNCKHELPPLFYRSTSVALKQTITPEIYNKLSNAFKKWYQPIFITN